MGLGSGIGTWPIDGNPVGQMLRWMSLSTLAFLHLLDGHLGKSCKEDKVDSHEDKEDVGMLYGEAVKTTTRKKNFRGEVGEEDRMDRAGSSVGDLGLDRMTGMTLGTEIQDRNPTLLELADQTRDKVEEGTARPGHEKNESWVGMGKEPCLGQGILAVGTGKE